MEEQNLESRAKDARCIRTLTFDPLPFRERGKGGARMRKAWQVMQSSQENQR